jgi:enoyl-[acyl-carrier protein] reductase I
MHVVVIVQGVEEGHNVLAGLRAHFDKILGEVADVGGDDVPTGGLERLGNVVKILDLREKTRALLPGGNFFRFERLDFLRPGFNGVAFGVAVGVGMRGFDHAQLCHCLKGKTGIVFGVANKRSIAWAIAQAWAREGARLAFTYQGERLKENVEELAGTFGADTLILPCDVTKDEDIAGVFKTVGEKFGKLNLLLHSVAFAPKDALEGEFVNTSREAFRVAHDVSAYSLVALARAAAPLMTDGGSIVAMSYYGAEKVVPHYNVMGVAKAALEASTRYLAYDLGPKKIRVNCISAGPVNTLAARGISGFSEMLKHYEARRRSSAMCCPRNSAPPAFPRQRRRGGHHRPGDLRGRRLPDHGDVTTRFTTNSCSGADMFSAVSLGVPSSRSPGAKAQMGGFAPSRLKKLNGAAFTLPSALMVVTRAMGAA